MRMRVGPIVKVLAVMCLLACASGSTAAQDDGDLTARQRIFPGVGPGLRSVKRGGDGRLYILASPSPGLQVFDPQGKQVLSIGELPGANASANPARPFIPFAKSCHPRSGASILCFCLLAGTDGATIQPPGLRRTRNSVHRA